MPTGHARRGLQAIAVPGAGATCRNGSGVSTPFLSRRRSDSVLTSVCGLSLTTRHTAYWLAVTEPRPPSGVHEVAPMWASALLFHQARRPVPGRAQSPCRDRELLVTPTFRGSAGPCRGAPRARYSRGQPLARERQGVAASTVNSPRIDPLDQRRKLPRSLREECDALDPIAPQSGCRRDGVTSTPPGAVRRLRQSFDVVVVAPDRSFAAHCSASVAHGPVQP